MKYLLVLLILMSFSGASFSDNAHSGEAFARVGDVVLTQELLDAAFSRIPEEHRLAFIRDSKKVDQLVKQILTNMILSKEARAAGFENEPHVAGRIELAVNKTLTEAWLEHQVRETPEPDYEALAREQYVLNPEEFLTPFRYDVTHLLVKTETRTEEDALTLANEILATVSENPGSFDELVRKYSESRDVTASGGRLVGVEKGQAVAEFENAALALSSPGDISGVVQTEYGFHIIRLDAKHEPEKMAFSDVKQRLIALQKASHLERTRTRIVMEAISAAPLEFEEGAIEKMLKRYFGEDLENAPNFGR